MAEILLEREAELADACEDLEPWKEKPAPGADGAHGWEAGGEPADEERGDEDANGSELLQGRVRKGAKGSAQRGNRGDNEEVGQHRGGGYWGRSTPTVRLWLNMIFIKKELQIIRSKVGEQLILDGEGGRISLPGYADHLGVSGAIRLDINLLKLIPAFCQVLARGDTPRTPSLHVKLQRGRHCRGDAMGSREGSQILCGRRWFGARAARIPAKI
jgi:hypothetical protein